MRRILFFGVIVLVFAGIAACSTSSSSGTTTHVYIGGQVGTSSSSHIPVYWKDGVQNMLPLGTATGGGAWGITEDKSGNIYVAAGLSNSPVGYYKNSTFVPLSLGTYAVGFTDSIAVDTSGNVWVGGEVGATTANTFAYWENSGAPTVLPGGPDNAWGLNADTAGNVYFIGTILVSGNDIPNVWKNGASQVALPFSGGNNHGYPANMTVDGSGNLYIFGQQFGGGGATNVYWKNVGGVWQAPVPFNPGTYFTGSYYATSYGGGVDASGNFQFATAYGATTPNSVLYFSSITAAPTAGTIPNGTTLVWAEGAQTAALDSSGNLYFVGQAGNTLSSGTGSQLSDGVPVYWKNGTATALPMGAGNTWGICGWVVIGP